MIGVWEKTAKVQISRSQLLSSSGRHTNDNNNRIPPVCRLNSHLPPLVKLLILRESFSIVQSNPHLRKTFDLPHAAYKRPRNLRNLLTSHPRADPNGPSKDRPNGIFPYEVAHCKTCEVVHNVQTFRYRTNDTHLVRNTFSYVCNKLRGRETVGPIKKTHGKNRVWLEGQGSYTEVVSFWFHCSFSTKTSMENIKWWSCPVLAALLGHTKVPMPDPFSVGYCFTFPLSAHFRWLYWARFSLSTEFRCTASFVYYVSGTG